MRAVSLRQRMTRVASALLLSMFLTVWLPGGARSGNLFSVEELARLRSWAQQGIAPYSDTRESLRGEANRTWRWGSVEGTFVTTSRSGGKVCHPETDPESVGYLADGAPDAYAKVLAYHLEDEPDLALAQEARQRVLALVGTEGFHGLDGDDSSGSNQCILELAVSVPVWIETALLLEETPVWSESDRTSFARWLAQQVYPRVAWASRVRRNNWGAAGSLSASLIARYVDGQALDLEEVAPVARSLDPVTARKEHDGIQLERIGTVWKGDSRCERFGIQDHGGIPDELRRGAGGCSATFIPSEDDRGLSYQTMHVELLVYHAEALRRAGEDLLYPASPVDGRPAILRAILFVIDNPSPDGLSWSWGYGVGALTRAYRVYRDSRLKEAVESASTFRGGRILPYATLVPPEASLLIGRPGRPRSVVP